MKNAPAFPLEMIYTKENEKFNGMTLRDYFAAKAMQGMVGREVSDPSRIEKYAENAYKMADAMLKARGQT